MGIQLNGNNDNISAVDGDLSITGIVTFSQLDVGNNIKFGNAGVVTATSFVGSGANLTGISGGVSGIDTTGQSHLKLLFVNAGVVTFTNTSNPTPSSTLPSGTGGTLYSFDNALNIVGGAGVGGSGGIVFKEGGFSRWRIVSGHFRPHSDSTVDIGTNSVRVRNIYADNLYGNGAVTINNNADNRLITGSGTANTLEGESTLTYDNGGLNIAGNSSRDGLKITNTGDHLGEICVTANRSSANSALMVIRGEWNNTEVASIYISAGSDTTNKDDGQIRFYTSPNSGTGIQARMTIDSNGHVLPGANDTYDLGSSSLRWRDIYTGDLNLSNEGSSNDVDATWGNYTIQEGENDLFLINNRSGKKYKFNLTEVS